MVVDIQINTYKTTGSSTIEAGDAKITVNVTKDEPWDKLSKIFKKYTHKINYPAGGGSGYKSSDYKITVYGPSGSSNKFTYKAPNERVFRVEIYFWANDNPSRGNVNPLVVGFISPNWRESGWSKGTKGCKSSNESEGSKCYYTWSYLTGNGKEFNGEIDDKNAISEKDLITVLLEELATRTPDREKQLVIRLDEQPAGGAGNKYPGSGQFKGKITVKKETVKSVTGYEKYEHTVRDSGEIENFYVSYNRDSKRIVTESILGSGYGSLQKVTGYFDNSSGTNRLVLITFSFTNRVGSLYAYSYQDFVNDLKNETKRVNPKTITSSDVITGGPSGIKGKLQEEIERSVQLIEFKDGGRRSKNIENITTSGLQNFGNDSAGQDYKFKKVTMTPKTSDNDLPNKRSVGPWTVFSTKLFNDNKGRAIGVNPTIKGTVLTNIYTKGNTANGDSKYSSITVYYATKSGSTHNYSDYSALLVEFCAGDGKKKYIKRGSADGTEWAPETISGDVDTGKLIEIGKEAGIIVVSKPAVSEPGASSNVGRGGNGGGPRQDSNPGGPGADPGTVGGVTAGTVTVGGIGGFVIYKYHGVLLALLGK